MLILTYVSRKLSRFVTRDLHVMQLCGIIVVFTQAKNHTSECCTLLYTNFLIIILWIVWFRIDARLVGLHSVKLRIWKIMQRSILARNPSIVKSVRQPLLIDLHWNDTEKFMKNMVCDRARPFQLIKHTIKLFIILQYDQVKLHHVNRQSTKTNKWLFIRKKSWIRKIMMKTNKLFWLEFKLHTYFMEARNSNFNAYAY